MAPHPTGNLPHEAGKNTLAPPNEPEGDVPGSLLSELERFVTELDREALLRLAAQQRQSIRIQAGEELEASEQRHHEPDAMETTYESKLPQLDTNDAARQKQFCELPGMENKDRLQQLNTNDTDEHLDNVSIQHIEQLSTDGADEKLDENDDRKQLDTSEVDYQRSMITAIKHYRDRLQAFENENATISDPEERLEQRLLWFKKSQSHDWYHDLVDSTEKKRDFHCHGGNAHGGI